MNLLRWDVWRSAVDVEQSRAKQSKASWGMMGERVLEKRIFVIDMHARLSTINLAAVRGIFPAKYQLNRCWSPNVSIPHSLPALYSIRAHGTCCLDPVEPGCPLTTFALILSNAPLQLFQSLLPISRDTVIQDIVHILAKLR